MNIEYRTVVGLGNPGTRYLGTRHNIGFAVADLLRASSGAHSSGDLHQRLAHNAPAAARGDLDTTGWQELEGRQEAALVVPHWSAMLVKPRTFMNRSGEPLQSLLAFKKIPVCEVIVVHDEVDLPLGSVRVKVGGGEGGHNGLRSISAECGGRDYARVRVGVGKPAPGSPLAASEEGLATWVLSRFSGEEAPFVEELLVRAASAVVTLACEGAAVAQNRFNR